MVRMQTDQGWQKQAKVVGKANRPRSYVVESEGKRYDRNRRHLLKVNEEREVDDEIKRLEESLMNMQCSSTRSPEKNNPVVPESTKEKPKIQ